MILSSIAAKVEFLEANAENSSLYSTQLAVLIRLMLEKETFVYFSRS